MVYLISNVPYLNKIYGFECSYFVEMDNKNQKTVKFFYMLF